MTRGTVTAITKRSLVVKQMAVLSLKTPLRMSDAGDEVGEVLRGGPFHSRPMLIRMNETPMAEMSGARRGARRRGR